MSDDYINGIDDRKKITRNTFHRHHSLSGAKLVLREAHRKYGVKRVREIPRAALRSVLVTVRHWSWSVSEAREYSEPKGIVRHEDLRRLGVVANKWAYAFLMEKEITPAFARVAEVHVGQFLSRF